MIVYFLYYVHSLQMLVQAAWYNLRGSKLETRDLYSFQPSGSHQGRWEGPVKFWISLGLLSVPTKLAEHNGIQLEWVLGHIGVEELEIAGQLA
jgi:hypothetical protein